MLTFFSSIIVCCQRYNLAPPGAVCMLTQKCRVLSRYGATHSRVQRTAAAGSGDAGTSILCCHLYRPTKTSIRQGFGGRWAETTVVHGHLSRILIIWLDLTIWIKLFIDFLCIHTKPKVYKIVKVVRQHMMMIPKHEYTYLLIIYTVAVFQASGIQIRHWSPMTFQL